MNRKFLGYRGIQLGAVVLTLVSMLSMIAWIIRTDQTLIGGQVRTETSLIVNFNGTPPIF